MMRPLPVLLLVACAPDRDLGPILSPGDGAVITAPVVPLILTVPPHLGAADRRVRIDGVDHTDPTTQERSVYTFLGGEHHLIGSLDLSDVDPGLHELSVILGRFPNRSRFASTFELAPPASTLRVRVEDEAGELVPGRVYLFDAQGALVDLTSAGTAVDHRGRDIDQNAIFCPDGTGMAWVAPGEYTLVGWRGLRADVDIQQVTLASGESLHTFTVPTAVETPGQVASDLHIHSGKSVDAWIPDRLRFDSLNTVGLDIYVLTDHNHVSDAPARSEASLPGATARAVSGSEVDLRLSRADGDGHNAAGHINVFPLRGDAQSEMPPTRRDTVGEIFASHRELEGAITLADVDHRMVIQLDHPRGIHFHWDESPQDVWQLFDYRGFDRSVSPGEGANAWMSEVHDGATALDFEVLEVVNRFSVPLYQSLRADWFHLLDEGYYRTASGNSDTHGLTVELAGMTVTMVEAARQDDGQVELSSWVDSLERGRATVSTGPFVTLEVDGLGPGDTWVAGGETEVRVRVQAADWVPVSEVRLIERSQLIWSVALSEADREADGRLDKTFLIDWTPGSEDSWLVAEAGYPIGQIPPPEELGIYAGIAPGYVPLAFTNALRIDPEGDGWYPRSVRGPLLPESKRPPEIPERLR